jgi:hypothetical protein
MMQEVILMPRSPRHVHWAAALEEEEMQNITIDNYAVRDSPLTIYERVMYFILVGCGGILLILTAVMIIYGIWYSAKAAKH